MAGPASLSIALAQFNPIVGDVAGNPRSCGARGRRRPPRAPTSSLFSELFLVGYPPEDLVLRPALVDGRGGGPARARARERGRRARRSSSRCPGREHGRVFNAVALVADGRIRSALQARAPQLRRVRREARVHAGPAAGAGRLPRRAAWGCRSAKTSGSPARRAASGRARAPSCCSCRTARRSKWTSRSSGCSWRASACAETGLAARLRQPGRRAGRARVRRRLVRGQHRRRAGVHDAVWTDAVQLTQLAPRRPPLLLRRARRSGSRNRGSQAVYHAMMLGLRDYVRKNRFPGVVLGLSGGIDSALTAAVAVDALGRRPRARRAAALALHVGAQPGRRRGVGATARHAARHAGRSRAR